MNRMAQTTFWIRAKLGGVVQVGEALVGGDRHTQERAKWLPSLLDFID